MNICVMGMGYVGITTAACLTAEGHHVTGVEINPIKSEKLKRGESPIVEPGIDELIDNAVKKQLLHVTDDAINAFDTSDLVFICVGTPSKEDGSINIEQLLQVVKQIAEYIKNGMAERYLSIVIRSTVLPGVIRNVLAPLVEEITAKKLGDGWGIAHNPEFLRETTAVKDFYDPSVTVVGAMDTTTEKRLGKIYSHLRAPVVNLDIDEAAMIKYANNAFHALKIVFANEIGRYSKKYNVDSRRVMDVLCMDNNLNISSAYLKPGFAFGGSCLPKDLKALTSDRKEKRSALPVLASIIESNQNVIRYVVENISKRTAEKILVVGMSFKAGTDDLRESPMVYLSLELLKNNHSVRYYDPIIDEKMLLGANKSFSENNLSGMKQVSVSEMKEFIVEYDCIILANFYPEIEKILKKLSGDISILDLYGSYAGKDIPGYDGLWW